MKMKSVAQIRAASLEKSQAFAAVIRLRADLSPLRQQLAGASPVATGLRFNQEHFHRLEDSINGKEAALHAATEFCMTVAPDLLTDHDAKAAAAEQAELIAQQATDAQHEINRRASLAKSHEAAQHRLAARQQAAFD